MFAGGGPEAHPKNFSTCEISQAVAKFRTATLHMLLFSPALCTILSYMIIIFYLYIYIKKKIAHANFRNLRNFTGCEFSQPATISQPHFVFIITFHPNSVLGIFGTVGNLREFRIQIYPERTLLKLL